MSRHRRFALVLAPFLVLALTSPVATASPVAPRLRLLASSPSVELLRYGSRSAVWLDLGIYLAALDAPFELRVRRESYDDPVRLWQAFHRPWGLHLEELPPELLDGWAGLRGFLRLQVFDGSGVLVRHRRSTLCPSGWQTARIDDSGPFDPTYPTGCGWNPFTMGAVWGIDQGWAVAPELSNGTIRIPDGRYVAKVSIMPTYRDLFGVADADASVEIAVRVRTVSGCRFCGPVTPTPEPTRRALTPAVSSDAPDPDTVPDLIALPAYGISISHEHGRDYLSFGADIWNRGPAPLVVEGFRIEGQDRMDAFQYFSRDGVVVGQAPVGSFAFDPRDGHRHWHILQFARYRLLDASQAVIVRSHKQSFCLAPTDPIDLTVDDAMWRPEGMGFSWCGSSTSMWIREVLPTGWGDTYFQSVAGQSFDVTALPNGSYWIEVQANPLGLLFDGDASNDVELREVILGGRPGARTVTVPAWHGIDTEY